MPFHPSIYGATAPSGSSPPSEDGSIFSVFSSSPLSSYYYDLQCVPPNDFLPSFSWFSHWSFIMKFTIENLFFFWGGGNSCIFHSYNITLPAKYSYFNSIMYQLLISFDTTVYSTENYKQLLQSLHLTRHVLVYMASSNCNILTSSKYYAAIVLYVSAASVV